MRGSFDHLGHEEQAAFDGRGACWLASRWLGSLASSRRRSCTSWMAATGWASGSTPGYPQPASFDDAEKAVQLREHALTFLGASSSRAKWAMRQCLGCAKREHLQKRM
jgi:hypothetical protein